MTIPPQPLPTPPPPSIRPGTDLPSLVLAAGVGIVLFASGIVNAVFGSMFPSNAPIESFWAFGITADLIAGGIALLVRLLLIRSRPRTVAPARSRPGTLVVTGVILSGVTVVGWLLFGGAAFLGHLAAGGADLRYYLDVSGAFFLGIPWMLGIFFGVAGFRVGRGPLNTAGSLVAIGLGLLILVPTLFSAIAYGLGLTN